MFKKALVTLIFGLFTIGPAVSVTFADTCCPRGTTLAKDGSACLDRSGGRTAPSTKYCAAAAPSALSEQPKAAEEQTKEEQSKEEQTKEEQPKQTGQPKPGKPHAATPALPEKSPTTAAGESRNCCPSGMTISKDGSSCLDRRGKRRAKPAGEFCKAETTKACCPKGATISKDGLACLDGRGGKIRTRPSNKLCSAR